MTEEEWETYTEELYLPSKRKQRLFMCAVCRRILQLTKDERCQKAIEVAERYADGKATLRELREASFHTRAAWVTAGEMVGNASKSIGKEAGDWIKNIRNSGSANPLIASFFGACVCTFPLWQRGNQAQIKNLTLLLLVTSAEAMLFGELKSAREALDVQQRIMQDIRCPTKLAIANNLLTSAVKQLAEAIYADRAFDRLPILADALEDAGCNNEDILTHCRSGGEHCRGCWVVDLILGKS